MIGSSLEPLSAMLSSAAAYHNYSEFYDKSTKVGIVSAARSLTCRDDLDSKWRLLLAENELSCVSLLSSISIGN